MFCLLFFGECPPSSPFAIRFVSGTGERMTWMVTLTFWPPISPTPKPTPAYTWVHLPLPPPPPHHPSTNNFSFQIPSGRGGSTHLYRHHQRCIGCTCCTWSVSWASPVHEPPSLRPKSLQPSLQRLFELHFFWRRTWLWSCLMFLYKCLVQNWPQKRFFLITL